MKRYITVLIFPILLYGCGSSGSSGGTPNYVSSDGPYTVSTDTTSLTDTTRGWHDGLSGNLSNLTSDREIPIKVYSPDLSNDGPFPLLLMSHGLWGDVDSTSYIGEHLASCGYIVVAVQHHRSDAKYYNEHTTTAERLDAADGEDTRLLRPQDMIFVLDTITSESTGIDLLASVRIDFTSVGVLGHSFGSFTTLACLGATFDGGNSESDARFLCGVAYSPQGPGTLGSETASWDNCDTPTLTLAGTNDTSVGTDDPLERRIPYDSMPANGAKYHGTVSGAEHDDFGNGGESYYHDWILQMTTAFFDAYLRSDTNALNWLNNKSIEKVTGYVAFEHK